MAESPFHWNAIEKCIFKHINKPGITIAQELKNSKLIPATTDIIGLGDKLDNGMEEYRKSLEAGTYGLSMIAHLAKLV